MSPSSEEAGRRLTRSRYIGWIPLELYESSGAAMRTRKAVHHHWPVPNQPELETEDLFGPKEIGVPHPFVVQA